MQSLKRKVTSGILAAVIALTPIAPEVKVIADEVVPSETQVVETSSDNGTQTTDAVAPTTTTTVATEPAQTEPANVETPETTIEVTDPSDSIDTTAPPTEETTEATFDETDATTSEPTDTTPVESSDETTEATEPTESSDETSETSETSETTEPTETPTPTPTPVEITCATVCETQKEYNDFVNGVSEEYWKIFVVTDDDLTDIVYDDARYYDGGYCFVFKTEEKFNTAVAYLTENGYEFTKVEAVTSKIVIAKDMEEFISYIKEMSGAKLIINTTADISKDLKPDAGIYFNGTYVISFANQNDYIDAATYCASKGYEYSLDGDLSVCGDEDIPTVINFALNNDATTRVAVIDTGSDIANEYYCVLDGDDGVDRNGHGTRMVNNILTYTDNAYIISIKALKDNGHGDVSDVYNAIQMAKTMNVDYILLAMSLKDNGEYDAFKALIEECKAQGITVIASAGNNNKTVSEYIPANCASVAVGALNTDGTKWALSNTGATWYVMADSTSDAASLYIGYTLGNLPEYINAGYSTVGSTEDNRTCGVEIEYAYTDNEGNEIDPVDFTVNYVVDPTISESGGNVTVTVKVYNTVIGVGDSIVSYGTAGGGRTAAQATELATKNANDAAGADVTRQMPGHQSEHSSAVDTVVNVLSSVNIGSTKSTTTHNSTDYHNGSGQNSTEVWVHTQRVYSSSTTVTWTISIGDGDIPTNSAAYQKLINLYNKGEVRIGYNSGSHETIYINFAEVADTISDKMISYRRSAGYCVRTGTHGLFAGSGRGHREEGGTGFCAAPAKGHSHYQDLSITDTISGHGLVGTPYTNYNKSMPTVGYFSFDGTCKTVAKILGYDGYTNARKQAWVWSHAGWNVEVNGGKPSDTPPSYEAKKREITSADGAKVAPYAPGWDNGVVRVNLVPQGNYPTNADGAYLLIPNQTYTFVDSNQYIQYMGNATYVDNNSGLVYSVNGNTLTVKLDPSQVTNWGALATGDAHLNFSRDNSAIRGDDNFHQNMKQWEDWSVYIYGTKHNNGAYYNYNDDSYQEHMRGVYDLYTAQWDMRGNINFYTNLYVYVAKESANSNSYNNCYSMEGVTFRMEGNNKVYQFTQPMGQTGGQTQAIKLTADDMAALYWNVYENDGTLPVRDFYGVQRNSGYLYDFSAHPVNYADAYYDPTFPVQGGGVADDGAVIKVLVQDVPNGDPLNQNVKKEDEEGWDETNAPSAATTDGIEFTVYYYADYFYDADSIATNFINYTDSTALYNYWKTHDATITAKITLSGQGTKKYGMFELSGDTFPQFSVDGTDDLRHGTYIVQETGTNNSYYLNSTPLFGTVISQKVNGQDSGEEQREYYFYNNETNNGPMGNTLYVKQYPKQTADAQCIVFNDKVIYGYANLVKVISYPTDPINDSLNGDMQGTSIDDTVYGIYTQSENKLYAVVVLGADGTMKSVTYPKDITPDTNVAPTINLVGDNKYFRLATGNYYATEIKPSDTNDVRNNGTYPDGSTNSGEVITQFVGQVVNQSMFYGGMEYNFTSGVQGEKLNFTVTACPELDVAAGETPTVDNVVQVNATNPPSYAEFDFNLDKVGYNGWKYYGAEFSIYMDEACTDANKVMTLTDNNDGHYVSTQANNIRDYLTYSPTSYTVASSGDLLFNYDVTVYFKETVAPTKLVDSDGKVWTIPEQNRTDIMDGVVYRVDIALHNVSQTTHIGTLTYTISGGHIQTPISFTINNYNAHESHNHADNGTVSEVKNIKLANDFDSKMYEDSMSLALLKTTDTPYLDINNNGRDDSTDYHFDIRTTWFFVTSGPLDGGYPTFTMTEMKNAKKEGRNLLKEYLLTQTNLIGYYDFGADQWYDSAQQSLPDGWDRLYGLQYDKTYYIYEVFEVPEYAYDNDNDPNPPGQNGVYDIAGEIFQIVTNQNGATSRENTERVYSSIPYPNLATGTYSEWEQSSYFNTMWEMHFDTPEFTVFKMNADESSITYDANNHLMYGDIDLNKVWSEDNTDGRQDLAGYEFLFEYGGNLDKAYWDMDDSEMAAVGMGSYSEIPHTYIIRLTDVNGNIHLEDVPAGWYRISENTNNMEVRFHSDRGADQQARATIKLVDGTEEVFYVVNIMDTPIYVNKFDTWTSEPIVIDPFNGERRAYEGDYSLRFELYTDSNKDGKITGAEWDSMRVIVDRSHSGLVAFNGLKSGQYAAREVITADGYYLDTGFRFVTIYDLDNSGTITDDIFEIKLYDTPYSEPITIEKFDAETQEPMDNAEFTIYYDNGSVVGEYDEDDEIAMTWEPELDENGNQKYEQILLGYYDMDGVWHDQLDADGNKMYVDGAPIGTYRPAEVRWDASQKKYVSDPLRAYHTWNSTTGQFEHRNYIVVETGLPYGYSFADANGEPTVKPDQAVFSIEYPDMQAEPSGQLEFVYRDGHIDPVETPIPEPTIQNFVMYNTPIHITTEALSIQNENHTLEVGESVDVKETINYENLAPTGRYTFRTLLLDKDNLDVNNPIATGSVSIVAENKNGSTSVTFTGVNSAELVKAIVNADGTVTYKAKDLVCYVYCDWDSDFDRYDGQRADHTDPNDTNETVTIENPTLHTTFTGTVTMTNNGLVGNTVDFNDKIEYTNLSIGEEYYTITSIVDKATGTVLTIKDADGNDVTEIKTTFVVPDTATKGNGTTTVNMVIDTSKLLTATTDANGVTTITGKDIVCFERLYTASGIYIATHEDVTDTAQTVTVVPPTISTTFVDSVTNEHLTPIGQDVPLTDIVKVTDNLNPNESYYVIGSIMDASTGKVLIDKETGKPIEVRKDFTTTAENYNNISVNVDFSVDTVDFVEWDSATNTLKTTKMVCFERLYAADGTLIAVHEDLTDENQTIAIVAPTLHTTLVDVASNSHDGSFGTSITLRDKVDYEYASAGTEYTIRGQLWKVNDDGSIEKLLDGDEDVTFTAEGRNGTQYVTFSNIDSTKLCENGKPIKVVCFEYMFCTAMVDDDNDDTTPTVEKEIQISSHEDVTDQNQTVEFKPTCETTLLVAKGENDGDNFDNKLLLDNKVQTLSDTVKVNDLIVNENYTVVGHLVDQETGAQLYRNEGGEELTTTLPFKADKADMEIVVDFKDVDTSTFGFYKLNEATGELEWTKPNQVVCFEELVSTTGFVFSLHHDLTDENQTVHRPHYLRVSIAKMDADNVKYYLSGAEITIYTGDGKVALDVNGNECVGLTDENGHIEFEIRYVEGQTYYAKETKAPAGYNLNEDKFQIKPVDAKGYGKEEIIPISIFDRIIIIPPHPKTGDSTPVMALIALIIVGAVGLTTLFIFKGKKKGQVEGNTSIEGVSNENPENDQN